MSVQAHSLGAWEFQKTRSAEAVNICSLCVYAYVASGAIVLTNIYCVALVMVWIETVADVSG